MSDDTIKTTYGHLLRFFDRKNYLFLDVCILRCFYVEHGINWY